MKIFSRSLAVCGVVTVLAVSACSDPPEAGQPPPLPSSVSSAAESSSAESSGVGSSSAGSSSSASTSSSVSSSVSSKSMTTSSAVSSASSSAASSSSAVSSSAASSASPSSPVSESPAVGSSPVGGGGEQISAQEAKDRKEIEAAWKGYWEISYRMNEIPVNDRMAEFRKFMVDPVLTELYDSSVIGDRRHWANYGEVVHYIKWSVPVDGKDTAVMLDCQDQTNFGVYDTRTNKGITRGFAKNNVNATFVRRPEGWRLAAYFTPKGTTCDQQ